MKNEILYMAALAMICTAGPVSARSWFAEPSISLSAGYNDNIRLESDDESESEPGILDETSDDEDLRDQSFALVGAELRLGSDTEADLIALDLAATARRFKASELDSEFFSVTAMYDRTGLKNDFRFELGTVTDTTIETEIEETGLLEENVDRDELFTEISLASRFTDQISGAFELGYSDVGFDAEDDTLTEFEQFTGSAQVDRILNERLSVFGLVEHVHYEPTSVISLGGIEKDTFSGVQLGVNYDLTENFAVILSAGQGFIDTDQAGDADSGSTQSIEFSDNKTIYNLEVDFTGKRNTADIIFRNTFAASADGGLSESQSYTFGFNRPQTLGGTFTIRAVYIKRDPVRGGALQRDFYALIPSIVWEANQNLSLSMESEFRKEKEIDSDTNFSERADSSSILFGLTYNFGRKRISY